jgi:hypothetical protein
MRRWTFVSLLAAVVAVPSSACIGFVPSPPLDSPNQVDESLYTPMTGDAESVSLDGLKTAQPFDWFVANDRLVFHVEVGKPCQPDPASDASPDVVEAWSTCKESLANPHPTLFNPSLVVQYTHGYMVTEPRTEPEIVAFLGTLDTPVKAALFLEILLQIKHDLTHYPLAWRAIYGGFEFVSHRDFYCGTEPFRVQVTVLGTVTVLDPPRGYRGCTG